MLWPSYGGAVLWECGVVMVWIGDGTMMRHDVTNLRDDDVILLQALKKVQNMR